MADPMFGFLTPEMRAAAETSVQQARKAFDDFMSMTQRAVSDFQGQASSAQSGVIGLQHKIIGFSERNLRALFDFGQRLMRAKDGQEVIELHADFVKSQIEALTEQAREISQMAGAAVPQSRSDGEGKVGSRR